jgi:hypothetical protein
MQVKRNSKSGPVVIADPLYGEPGTALVAKGAPGRLKLAASVASQRSAITAEDLNGVYFAPLRGTEREARVIRTLFPDAQVFTGAQATKGALNRLVAPSILHIATHGFFLAEAATGEPPDSIIPQAATRRKARVKLRIENPRCAPAWLSGANLSKGAKKAFLLRWRLQPQPLGYEAGDALGLRDRCGEEDGEGVYGLRRSFFLAGSEALVMSLSVRAIRSLKR